MNICPTCGASRDALREMLATKWTPLGDGTATYLIETENHAIARIVLNNCADCREANYDVQRTMPER